MGKSTKSQRLRERMRAEVKHSKQATLGNQPELQKQEPAKPVVQEPKKQIELTEISSSIREDELVLKIGFKLRPSRTAFLRVIADLYFDEEKIDSVRLRVLQGQLAADDLEFSSVLDMTGIGEGEHLLRVDMFELWSLDEKLTCISKEVTIHYVPLKREDRRVRVPIIRRVAGADLEIVTDSEKNIYREIEENMKEEEISRRDDW
jgi:hypothetical protein